MVLVTSRFRVANGLQLQVKEAFRNRPRLVEGAPGFLGLEVFTDAADNSIFYLLTRWTDAESFRRWHSGEAHHVSHRGIPKGLKLDAAYTRIEILECLDDANGQERRDPE